MEVLVEEHELAEGGILHVARGVSVEGAPAGAGKVSKDSFRHLAPLRVIPYESSDTLSSDAELHVWGGAFHGFYAIAPNSELARSCIAAREAWLERMLTR